jgi:hypothetical protein
LRELARKQAEYAALPIMAERQARWYRHNDLLGDGPMIQFETWTFEGDLLPAPRCRSKAAAEIELQIQRTILNHERIDDDRVVGPTFDIEWKRSFKLFGLEKETVHAEDSMGRSLGYRHKHPIVDLAGDLPVLGPTVAGIDRAETLAWKSFVEEQIGDLLPVRLANGSPAICLTQDLVHFMGMEAMFLSMMDCPEAFRAAMDRMSADHLAWLLEQERDGLWFLNNGHDWLCQGSSAFTRDLPRPGREEGAPVAVADLWGFMDSQETLAISPAMFAELVFPYYRRVAERFGLLSYGCCEPVHAIWKDCLSTLPNLRKVSVSPWCDQAFMGEALRGSRTIFHRKPSPMEIGREGPLDEEALAASFRETLECARGCALEFSFRDIYTLGGQSEKARQAVRILREQIDRRWLA